MKYILIFTLGIFIFSNCKKEEDTTPTPTPTPVSTRIDSIITGFGGVPGGPPIPFAYYSLETGKTIDASQASTKNWDFGFSFIKVAFNSNFSGPGNAGLIHEKSSIFSTVSSAPESGYAYDTTDTRRALKNEEWYNYNSATRTFNPKAGQTFIIRTANGKYAKMELLKIDYKDIVGMLPTKVQYTFRYAFQGNGTRNF
jgi:hypothetical protein